MQIFPRIVADTQVHKEPHGLHSGKVFESQLALVKLLAVLVKTLKFRGVDQHVVPQWLPGRGIHVYSQHVLVIGQNTLTLMSVLIMLLATRGLCSTSLPWTKPAPVIASTYFRLNLVFLCNNFFDHFRIEAHLFCEWSSKLLVYLILRFIDDLDLPPLRLWRLIAASLLLPTRGWLRFLNTRLTEWSTYGLLVLLHFLKYYKEKN
jgi:hypothetical protein